MQVMRKLIVIVTLLYTAAAVAALGWLSDGFREVSFLTGSPIAVALAAGVPSALIVAVIAYRQYNEWLVLVLLAIVIGSSGYVANVHHERFGTWLPAIASAEVASSGTATLTAHGQTLRYRLDLHDPGTVAHREFLVVTRGGKESRLRLPIFDDARSGYVSARSPDDWIVLEPTADADVYRVRTGEFLIVRKEFRVNLGTGEVTTRAAAPAG
jgi:hypothetical protein